MFVPVEFRPAIYTGVQFFHPLFLYEAIGNVLILALLLWKSRQWQNKKGTIFFSYLILYGILRFILEFLRIDTVLINGLRLNALVSLLFVFASITGLYVRKTRF
jgi:phosphatidylglycerol:prolipoprotein diacylglycerol transferase